MHRTEEAELHSHKLGEDLVPEIQGDPVYRAVLQKNLQILQDKVEQGNGNP
ncbi:hypothetical protein D3C76_585740 [compost metagenome]